MHPHILFKHTYSDNNKPFSFFERPPDIQNILLNLCLFHLELRCMSEYEFISFSKQHINFPSVTKITDRGGLNSLPLTFRVFISFPPFLSHSFRREVYLQAVICTYKKQLNE